MHVAKKPRLLSDNRFSQVSRALVRWLKDNGTKYFHRLPCHPQTQGKIQRWHKNLKNHVLLERDFLSNDLKAQTEAFVDYYNQPSYHESAKN